MNTKTKTYTLYRIHYCSEHRDMYGYDTKDVTDISWTIDLGGNVVLTPVCGDGKILYFEKEHKNFAEKLCEVFNKNESSGKYSLIEEEFIIYVRER